LVLGSSLLVFVNGEGKQLTSDESAVMSRINETEAYNYDLELERMTLDPNISGYSFRSSGSPGATASADWIQQQFEDFGLDTHNESFEFTTWNLNNKPTLTIDLDGNQSTTDDQATINSFQPEHFSWPTPNGGVCSELITLPMPVAHNLNSMRTVHYDAIGWNATNTTGMILLIGRELRVSGTLNLILKAKLQTQPPAALIFTWWYDWMSWVPPMFNSIGGRPASRWGDYLWNLKIPVGWVNYEDGQRIRNEMSNKPTMTANVTIDASIGTGPHYTVIGRLQGSTNPDKMIIVSAHYDTVMDSGFCDNGAGVAGMLDLAKVFSEAARNGVYRSRYTLVFIAFAAEELGLVGSINYVNQHRSDLKNTIAVLNLDCIGSKVFEISETFPDDNRLNLMDTVKKAAEDLGLSVRTTETGGSDQETFRNPAETNEEYKMIWGADAEIANNTRVKSSIMICSYPLFYSDKWDNGTPGWIHTPYDNSTSIDWVDAGRLEMHIKATGLSIVRLSSAPADQLILQGYAVAASASLALAIIIYVKRRRVYIWAKGFAYEVHRSFGTREIVYTLILTVIFLFLSFAFFMRPGRVEVSVNSLPTPVNMSFYGKPFEMLGITSANIVTGESGEISVEINQDYQGAISIFWEGLILNTALYALLAFMIVYAVIRLRYLIDYSKSHGAKSPAEDRFLACSPIVFQPVSQTDASNGGIIKVAQEE
jgi:hypothetical protein